MKSKWRWAVAASSLWLALASGCAGSNGAPTHGMAGAPNAGTAGASGGMFGTAGAQAGSAGQGDTGGNAGTSGGAGSPGSSGSAGSSGNPGSAGSSGVAGDSGAAGVAGVAGTSGEGGAGAAAGSAGSAGSSAGNSGSAGTGAGGSSAGSGGAPNASALITAARAAADGTGLELPIVNAIVTYLKPGFFNDVAGFTIQAEKLGPALFVAVDPATLSPAPAVGDTVSFTITALSTVAGERRATGVSGFARTATGADVGALVQDVSAATDLVSSLGSYEDEVIQLNATVSTAFTSSGSGFVAAQITTAGLPTASASLVLRVPQTLRDAVDLVPSCQLAVSGVPLGRFNADAQVQAYFTPDISSINACPAPTVVSAAALSATSVQVTFSRHLGPASVLVNGSQFTVDNGLVGSSAAVSGNTVTLVTSTQSAGQSYTLNVANSVTDALGSALVAPSSASFLGYSIPAGVRINELNANITGGCDLIELRVVSGGSLTGFKVRERTGDVASGELAFTFPPMTVNKNDLVVLHLNGGSATCNPGGASGETTSASAQPASTFGANFDTAYDLYSNDTGLAATDNVITVYDASGSIVDAVFLSDDPTGTTAQNTNAQAAAVADVGQWQVVGGGVPSGGFVDDAFCANAALDLNATGTTRSPSLNTTHPLG